MLTKFTAQNFEGDVYTALDFSESDAFLYFAEGGDVAVLKRMFQLLWASTTDDGVKLDLMLKNSPHFISSDGDKISFDDVEIDQTQLEKIYSIRLSDYAKFFVISYTQMLNLELSRVRFTNYLNKYGFHKAESKSYYSPLEDIFYDIEQARRYSNPSLESSVPVENTNDEKIQKLQKRIMDLENAKNSSSAPTDQVDSQIQALENEIQLQQSLDNITLQKGDLEQELSDLNIKISDYEGAMKKISEVEMDMTKYTSFMKIDSSRVENDLSMFSYRIREREKTLSDLANSRVAYADDIKHLTFLPIILPTVLGFSVGAMLLLISNFFIGVIAAFIGLVVSILVLLFKSNSKVITPSRRLNSENVAAIANELDALKSAKLRYIHNLGFNNEDDYFATKALVRALIFQKENDLSKVHERFSGLEISDLKMKYAQIQQKINALNLQTNSNNLIMSPDEYIRKRRELDMLKLEKSMQNNSTQPVGDSADLILELRHQIQVLQSQTIGIKAPDEKFLQILREYFQNNEITATSDYVLENIDISTYEEKIEMLIIQRLAYIKSIYPDVELPLLLDDPFTGIENPDRINKILDFCRQKIQVILVTEHDKYGDLDNVKNLGI